MGERHEYRVACYGLIENDAGQYLLIKRSPDSGHFAGKWQIPGGKPDPGESADQTLRREVKEETGLDVNVLGLAGCTEFVLEEFRVAMLVFRCHCPGGEIALSDEHVAAEWVGEDDLLKRDLTGQDRRFLRRYFRDRGRARDE